MELTKQHKCVIILLSIIRMGEGATASHAVAQTMRCGEVGTQEILILSFAGSNPAISGLAFSFGNLLSFILLTARKDEKCRGVKFRPSVRNMSACRNWQTRRSQTPLLCACGFKPHR